MRTTFLLLRGFFDLVPLQRWINALSLLLLAVAVLAAMSGRNNGTLGFTLLGVVLLAIAPVILGGAALRFASTRSALYLRPHGRIRLLIAATVALTLLALLLTLPFCIEQWLEIPRRGARIDPGHVFPIAWSGLALLWICVFAVSHSMHTLGLVGLVPLALVTLSRVLMPHLPHPAWLMLPAAAAWLGFSAWYLRTNSVARPQLASSTQSALDGGSFTPLHRLFACVTPKGELSATQAQSMYLLGGLPSMFAITGVWIAGLFFLFHLLVQWFGAPAARPGSYGPANLLFMLPFIGFFMFSLGFNTVRRARYLWLRERLDRRGLFGLAEQRGLRASLSGWGVTAAIIAVIELLRDPGNAGYVPVYLLAHAALAICLFYGGMASTRTWSVRDVTLGAVIWIGFAVQVYQLSPERHPDSGTVLNFELANLIFALLLRWYALRIWQGLDWRITTLPRPGERNCR